MISFITGVIGNVLSFIFIGAVLIVGLVVLFLSAIVNIVT